MIRSRGFVLLVAFVALIALPAHAQDAANGDITLTTPDGVEHTCAEDFPGASFEAYLVSQGFTERYTLEGRVSNQSSLLVLLCLPNQ